MFTPHIDVSHYAGITIANNVTMVAPPHIELPTLSFNPSLIINVPSMIQNNQATLPIIDFSHISQMKSSFGEIPITNNEQSQSLANFRTSLNENMAQLHPFTKSECIKGCETAPQLNNQLQCGIPNSITGLISRKPEKAQCVIQLEQQKRECLDGCHKIKN